VGETDLNALLADLERSRAARLKAWAVLGELRAILAAAGEELGEPARKSFVEEGRILERGLRKALTQRDEALRDLAAAARWVDPFVISKAAKKHPDVIRQRCKMIDLKGMRRIIEFRVKVSQKTLNNPDEVAISTLVCLVDTSVAAARRLSA
jgi:hypothetical protein